MKRSPWALDFQRHGHPHMERPRLTRAGAGSPGATTPSPFAASKRFPRALACRTQGLLPPERPRLTRAGAGSWRRARRAAARQIVLGQGRCTSEAGARQAYGSEAVARRAGAGDPSPPTAPTDPCGCRHFGASCAVAHRKICPADILSLSQASLPEPVIPAIRMTRLTHFF
jgi:hypothetical protein